MLRHCAGGSGNLVVLWNNPFGWWKEGSERERERDTHTHIKIKCRHFFWVVRLATARALWVKQLNGHLEKLLPPQTSVKPLWGIHRYSSWRERQEELGLLDPSCGQRYHADVPFGPECQAWPHEVPDKTAGNLAVPLVWNQTMVPLTHKLAASRPDGPIWNGLVVELSRYSVALASARRRRPLLRSDSRPKIGGAAGHLMETWTWLPSQIPDPKRFFISHL